MSMFDDSKSIFNKYQFYRIASALMLCGAAIAYMRIRFTDVGALQETTALMEMSGVLFVLALVCTAVSIKCSSALKQSSSWTESAQRGLKSVTNHQMALMWLSQSDHIAEGNLTEAAREVTETLGGTLEVERASVWLISEKEREIYCLDFHSNSTKKHCIKDPIAFDKLSSYFSALKSSRTIAVEDAQHDQRTKELCRDYLIPFNILSTLDSSIRVAGEVVGYVLLGSEATKRDWTSHEASFVAAVADQFGQAITNHDKHRTLVAVNKAMLEISSVTGDEFFELLVCQLCSVLEVKYSMVTEWCDCKEENMRSLALADDGEIAPPLEYALEYTPCADVILNGFTNVPEKLQQLYPKDDIAVDLELESYIGAPLLDTTGKKIGILNVFHTEKIKDPKAARVLLEIFAIRTAIELERIKSLKTLKTNQALLDATLNSTADGLLVTGNDGKVLLTSIQFRKLWGIPSQLLAEGEDQKLLAYAVKQLKDPDKFIKKVKELQASPNEDFDVLFFTDGKIFERYSCPLILDGEVEGRVWSFRDITVKERAVASLQESEDRYHSIFDSSSDGFMIIDSHGRIKEVNRAICRMHGRTEEEFLRLEPQEFVHPDSLSIFQEFLECLSRGEEFQSVAQGIRKDGSTIDIDVTGVPLPFGGEPHFLGVLRDVSGRKSRERKEQVMQDKLDRAERMQSIGVLAGGVAHDLNNILGPLVAYPELILMRLPEDSPLRGRIELIGNSAKHAAEVIQDLLTLARRDRVEFQPISLNGVVSDVMKSTNFVDLERENPRIKMSVNTDSELPTISASKSHLAKAIFNLCANAFAAMPEGGELRIETSKSFLEELPSGYAIEEAGDFVRIEISDTGKALAQEQIAKLFEPYYNKKNVQESASGLGLAIVYSVIKDHGGYYDVSSEPGKGTTFSVFLPVVSEAIQPEYLKPSSYRGSESVLVVDDDQSQRNLACALLESLGYDVYAAPNGKSAIELLDTRPADLVVLDMIMEGSLDGLDTYRIMLKKYPRQKAVVVSGFAATDRVDEIQNLGALSYVRKPYSRDAIGKAVRETLDRVVSAPTVRS